MGWLCSEDGDRVNVSRPDLVGPEPALVFVVEGGALVEVVAKLAIGVKGQFLQHNPAPGGEREPPGGRGRGAASVSSTSGGKLSASDPGVETGVSDDG